MGRVRGCQESSINLSYPERLRGRGVRTNRVWGPSVLLDADDLRRAKEPSPSGRGRWDADGRIVGHDVGPDLDHRALPLKQKACALVVLGEHVRAELAGERMSVQLDGPAGKHVHGPKR